MGAAVAFRPPRGGNAAVAALRRGPPAARAARLALALALLALASCGEGETGENARLVQGDPDSGRRAIARLGCTACHAIPGVRGPRGRVGPPLDGFARRGYIAGILPNRPGLLVQWIRNAPKFAPDTAMPAFPMTEREARDIASYLYMLE